MPRGIGVHDGIADIFYVGEPEEEIVNNPVNGGNVVEDEPVVEPSKSVFDCLKED